MKKSEEMMFSKQRRIHILHLPRLFWAIYLANRKRKSIAVSLRIARHNSRIIRHEFLKRS
ncbi:MAG: hypothetical protein ACE3JK_05415 [Sporolactobacillus sp.]